MVRRSPLLLARMAALIVALGVLLALNAFIATGRINGYFVRVLLLIGINITMAVSLNVINGFTGQFSIGHAGFMSVGAYTGAYLSVNAGARLAHAFGLAPDSPAADFLILGTAL